MALKPIPQNDSLNKALRHFEVAEANLFKLEKLWKEIYELIPDGIAFGSNQAYNDKVLSYEMILKELPNIDDFKPSTIPWDLDTIGQNRFDAMELGELNFTVDLENQITAPETELRTYRFLFNNKRKELVRDQLTQLISLVDKDIVKIAKSKKWSDKDWNELENHVGQIDALLGSSTRPPRWSDLQRHLHFKEPGDFSDIKKMDWPSVKPYLLKNMYGEDDPIPSEIKDLSALVATKPRGKVSQKLNWGKLDDESFERLVYQLISEADGYENPQWLTNTKAADKGRDLSAYRIIRDSLGGVDRLRVILQCKHWLSKSVGLPDLALIEKQMKLWEPPRVDLCIIVTSGRFTSDAVSFVEKNNQSDKAMRIEMWAESHLESLLASRPHLIAQFNLR